VLVEAIENKNRLQPLNARLVETTFPI